MAKTQSPHLSNDHTLMLITSLKIDKPKIMGYACSLLGDLGAAIVMLLKTHYIFNPLMQGNHIMFQQFLVDQCFRNKDQHKQ